MRKHLGVSLAALLALATSTRAEVENFTFIHFSDNHVGPHLEMPEMNNSLRGYQATRTLAELGEVEMTPFGITSDKPAFYINTGDITEYGWPDPTTEVMEKYFEGFGPVYMIAGNHDNTWVTDVNLFREMYGGLHYTFDHGGIRFLGINTATIQEPRPSIPREAILYTRAVLSKTPKEMPVIVFLHHPLWSNEFASRYDVDRLMDELRANNVVAILVGHGHSPVFRETYGIINIMGGSTFSKSDDPTDGYNIIAVRDGKLHVGYHYAVTERPMRKLGEVSLTPGDGYPRIDIATPKEGEIITRDEIRVSIPATALLREYKEAKWSLNDESEGTLTLRGRNFEARIPAPEINGLNFLRVVFVDGDGKEYTRSVSFSVDRRNAVGSTRAAWKRKLFAASQATPVVEDGVVYLGDNSGALYAITAKNGKVRWKRDMGGEIIRAVTIAEDRVIAGATNGTISAVATNGYPQWVTYTGSPVSNSKGVFAPPIVHDGVIYIGDGAANMHALDLISGQILWTNRDADYAIEAAAAVVGDLIVYTAWDGYVYAVNRKDGKLAWKVPNWHHGDRVVRYYGAADNRVLVGKDRWLLADRGYASGAWDFEGNRLNPISTDAAALALSSDGQHVFVRGQNTAFEKRTIGGDLVWSNPVVGGRIPAEPTVDGNTVYLTTNNGTLHSINATTGATQWRYQVAPQLYVLGSPAVDKDHVYTVDMDGNLLAIRKPAQR